MGYVQACFANKTLQARLSNQNQQPRSTIIRLRLPRTMLYLASLVGQQTFDAGLLAAAAAAVAAVFCFAC
jgi:hypothetical protein